MEIICAADEPVLSRYKGDGSYRDLGDFKCLDERACFVIPDEDISSVQTSLLWESRLRAYRSCGCIGVFVDEGAADVDDGRK